MLWPGKCWEKSFSFLFAPKFHSSLKNVSEIRKSLPFRTIFNLLGPLLNPAKLTYQIIGVSEEKNLITHAKCLKKFGIKNAWIVFCKKGYDELTTISDNIIVTLEYGFNIGAALPFARALNLFITILFPQYASLTIKLSISY